MRSLVENMVQCTFVKENPLVDYFRVIFLPGLTKFKVKYIKHVFANIFLYHTEFRSAITLINSFIKGLSSVRPCVYSVRETARQQAGETSKDGASMLFLILTRNTRKIFWWLSLESMIHLCCLYSTKRFYRSGFWLQPSSFPCLCNPLCCSALRHPYSFYNLRPSAL